MPKIITPAQSNFYRQSWKTAEGFQKMKRRGIVLPPFQVEQSAAKLMYGELESLIALMRKAVVSASMQTGQGIQDEEDDLTRQAIKRIREQLAQLNAAGDLSEDEERIRLQLSNQLAIAQQHFFRDFFEDASERLKTSISFSLQKDEVFKNRLDGIRRGYLDTAVERISEGKSFLRKRFIGILEQWVEGEREDLEGFDDLMDKIHAESLNFSKFFARDQFSRFNKALMVSSYAEAGAKWIRWVTVGDARVRKSHRELQGKIFAIDDLPKEYEAYNCRCGFVPVFELGTKQVTPGDGVRLAA